MAAPVWWDTKAYNPRQPRIPGGQTGGGRWGGGVRPVIQAGAAGAWREGLSDDDRSLMKEWQMDRSPQAYGEIRSGTGERGDRFRALVGTAPAHAGLVYHGTSGIGPRPEGRPADVLQSEWEARLGTALKIPGPGRGNFMSMSTESDIAGGFGAVVLEMEADGLPSVGTSLYEVVGLKGTFTPTATRIEAMKPISFFGSRTELSERSVLVVTGTYTPAPSEVRQLRRVSETKAYNPRQPRIPGGQPGGGRSEKSTPPPWWTKDFNPAQPRIPAGKPGGGRWGSDIGATLLDTIANIESTGLTPGGGDYYGDVKIVTDDQGRRAVVKVSTSKDAELLTSRLGAALGAPVPVVVDADNEGIAMEFIDGKHLGDFGVVTARDVVWDADNVLRGAAETPAGRRLAMLEALTNAGDRHALNYIFTDPDDDLGSIVGIDYEESLGGAWGGSSLFNHFSVLAQSLGVPMGASDARGHTFTAAEVGEARTAVEAVRGDFGATAALTEEWAHMMARVQALEAALEAKSATPSRGLGTRDDLGAGEVHEVIAGAATRRAEEGKSAPPPWWSDLWGLDRGGGPRSGSEPPGEDPGRLTKSAPPSWWETKRRPWVERLHPRSDDGRFSLRGFDVVRTDPLPDMAKHVGKPWYGVDDWGDVTVDLDKHFATAEAYEALPEWDDAAKPNYDAFITELDVQYETLTKELGIKVEVMDTDPYPDVQAMMADVRDNRTIKVLSTKATPPGHAYLTDDENDRFRAVHDAFGHAGTGRGFDRHGEEAAYQAHANMFTQQARLALATETRGQNAVLIRSAVLTGKGEFPPQKFAVLDPIHTKAAAVPSDRNDITDVERRNTSLGRHPRNMTAEEMDAWRARRARARGLDTKSTPPSWWTKAYNPKQPRIPGGQTGGGRWGGGIVSAATKVLDLPPPATSRAPELWGRNDLGLVFPDRGHGPSPSALTPWPPAAKRRPHGQFDPAPVKAALLDPPPTTLVDPRSLHSTQPGLQYPAANYYFSDEAYNETGRTFADAAQAGNRVPVVYRRPGPFGEQLLLLSGHHRGLAALLKGQPLEAIVVEGS